MPSRKPMLAAPLGALLLTACFSGPQNEQQQRQSDRDMYIFACKVGAAGNSELGDIDPDRLCSCIVDRTMADASGDEAARRLSNDDLRDRASQACLAEIQGRPLRPDEPPPPEEDVPTNGEVVPPAGIRVPVPGEPVPPVVAPTPGLDGMDDMNAEVNRIRAEAERSADRARRAAGQR